MKRLYVCPQMEEMPSDGDMLLVGSPLVLTPGSKGTKDDDAESKRGSTVWDEWDFPDDERTVE